MAKLCFTDLKPISINSAYYRNRKITEKARIFRSKFLIQLQSQLSTLKEIQDKFDPLKHCLAFSFTFGIPNEYFFTKKGTLSHRSQDLDNCLKLIIDFVCNTRYDTTWLLNRFPKEKRLFGSLKQLGNLAIDDKVIQEIYATKVPDSAYTITISIDLLNLPSPYSLYELDCPNK